MNLWIAKQEYQVVRELRVEDRSSCGISTCDVLHSVTLYVAYEL